MSQQVLRPLRQWPWLRHRTTTSSVTVTVTVTVPLQHFHHLLTSLPPPEPTKTFHRFLLPPPLASSRRDIRTTNVPLPFPTELDNRGTDSDSAPKKSRNELKREARRAVKWGMDLASFSAPQIKRILRLASLDQVVFEALMLVKRLGPDVREGRRRQFNYIGKLLREVEPELMDRLIKATKDSDQKELQALTGLVSDDVEDDDDELTETEDKEDEKESSWHDSQVTRWFDGLINKDIQITNEVYSVQGVEFDRQELRKLVRRVHFAQEMKANDEEEEKKRDTAIVGAKKSLTRFLRGLSKRIPDEY